MTLPGIRRPRARTDDYGAISHGYLQNEGSGASEGAECDHESGDQRREDAAAGARQPDAHEDDRQSRAGGVRRRRHGANGTRTAFCWREDAASSRRDAEHQGNAQTAGRGIYAAVIDWPEEYWDITLDDGHVWCLSDVEQLLLTQRFHEGALAATVTDLFDRRITVEKSRIASMFRVSPDHLFPWQDERSDD
jgi:hypothetical protein